jgi:hypothetical protein
MAGSQRTLVTAPNGWSLVHQGSRNGLGIVSLAEGSSNSHIFCSGMPTLVPVFSIERDGHHPRYLHVGIDSLKLMRAVSSRRDLSNFLAIFTIPKSRTSWRHLEGGFPTVLNHRLYFQSFWLTSRLFVNYL